MTLFFKDVIAGSNFTHVYLFRTYF